MIITNMKTERQQMAKIIDELPDQKLGGKELIALLYNLTGHHYTFTNSPSMRWGKKGKLKEATDVDPDGFYQIVPEDNDEGFFDWYRVNREEYQFFKSRSKAVLHFIFYWMKWRDADKPGRK